MTAKKKILLGLGTLVAVVAIVVASVAGTVAYLTSSAAVLNAFTVGNVTMQLYESKVNSKGQILNADGTVWNGQGTAPKKTADVNSYHLVDNEEYVKDPTLFLKPGSEPSYLFIISKNEIRSIEKPEVLTMREQLLANGWMKYGNVEEGGIFVYTGVEKQAGWADAVQAAFNPYASLIAECKTLEEKQVLVEQRFQAILKLYETFNGGVKAVAESNSGAVDKEYTLFTKFTVASEAQVDTLANIYNSARVEVIAVAIQAAGFGVVDGEEQIGSDAALQEAWAAAAKAHPNIGNIITDSDEEENQGGTEQE